LRNASGFSCFCVLSNPDYLPAPIPWRSESGPKVLSSQLGRKICGKALSELGNASGDP
jgi:hypothetical protein